MSKYKIAIGLTSNNCLVHWVTLISAFQAMSGRDWSDYHFEPVPAFGIYINYNRNCVVDYFLDKTECDYLMFLDYDNGFFPEVFDLFMEDMSDPEVKIVSGTYYLKDPKKRTYVAGQQAETSELFICDFYPEEAFVGERLINITKNHSSGNGLVGAGCLMVKREVFEDLDKPWFDNRYHNKVLKDERKILMFLGEDNYFCLHAQDNGYDIYLDTRIKSPHMAGKACFPYEWKQFEEAN